MALSKRTKKNIENRVKLFHEARVIVEKHVKQYLEEYRKMTNAETKISSLRIQEYLHSDLNSTEHPALTRLVLKGNNTDYIWTLDDIAVIIGKVRQTPSHIIKVMEKFDVWRNKLIDCRTNRPAKGEPAYRYSQEVFDVILDFYEEGAMKTFFKPSRGEPKSEEDQNEIRTLWEKTKKSLLKIQKSLLKTQK